MKKVVSFFISLVIVLQMCTFATYAEVTQQKQNGLANSLWQLKNGETFTVGYLGGSITVGFGSTTTQGYANLSYNAIKNQNARTGLKFTKYQAGVGGTGSNYGALRINEDFYLSNPNKVPDLAFIEFGVNDKYHELTSAQSKKYMETIVRKCYAANPEMDIVFLYTTDNADKGEETTQIRAHMEVAEKYGIPDLNIGAALLKQIRSEVVQGSDGKTNFNEIWSKYVYDSVHPADPGYEVYSATIMEMLNSEWAKDVPQSQTPMVLSAPSFGAVDDVYLAGVKDYTPLEGQMGAKSQSGSGVAEFWKNGSTYLSITGPGQDYSFKFTGTGLMARLDQNTKEGVGKINFYIDGKSYPVSSYHRSGIFEIATDLEYGEHTVLVYSTDSTLKNISKVNLQGFGIIGDKDKKGITTTSVDVDAIVGTPVHLIDGNEVGLTFEYPGKTYDDKGTYDNDTNKEGYIADVKASKYEYDSETGVASIELTNPVYATNNAYFNIYAKNNISIKKTPYMAVGMYYSNSAETEATAADIMLNNGNALTGKTYTFSETLSNQVIDLTEYTSGTNGGYSSQGSSVTFKNIQITPAFDEGSRVPAGTKIGVQYIAFFDTLEAAQNYTYQKSAVETPYYVEDNKITILQHNLQGDASIQNITVDGETSQVTLTAQDRLSGFVSELDEYKPDIMCYQEAESAWAGIMSDWATENGYDNIYNYRPYDSTTKESTPIMWNAEKFSVVDTGYFWLRDDPTKMGTNTWGGGDQIRGCTWVKFKVNKTSSYFYVLNTQVGLNYAEEQKTAELLINMISAEEPLYNGIYICNDAPVVLAGDFNSTHNSSAMATYEYYLDNADADRSNVFTLNDETPWNDEYDHCLFTGAEIASLGYEADLEKRATYNGENCYVSDHKALVSEIAILGEPIAYVLPEISISTDKDEVAEGEKLTASAIVTTPNQVSSVEFFVDDVKCTGTVTAKGNEYSIEIGDIPFGYHYVKAVVTDEFNNKARDDVRVFSKRPYVTIVPEVFINAGKYKDATPSYNYKNGAALMRGGNYNNPNLNVQYGIFMKINLPELPENYEIKKARMMGSLYYTSHLNDAGTGQKGSTFLYNLTGDIESDYKYYTDTVTYPEKNLALLVPSGENAYALKSSCTYTGANYTPNVVDNYNYDITLNVLNYIKSLYGDSKQAVTQSLLAISNQDLAFRGKNMNNPVVFYLEIGEKLDAEFVSNNYAYENEGFAVAISANTSNIKTVSFTVNETEYVGAVNDKGEWTAYVEGGLPVGDYTITANVTDNYGATTEKTQVFKVINGNKFVTGNYVAKLQSSDGKIWTVAAANNYDLRTQNSKVADCLYTSMNITSLTDADIIDKVYLVSSSSSKQSENIKFVIEECGPVNSTVLPGGKVPASLPELGEEVTSGVYTQISIDEADKDYAQIKANVKTKAGTAVNYIKLDVTEHIKKLVDEGATRFYFRASTVNAQGGSYSLSVNNARFDLYVKFKDPDFIDNHDGTVTFVARSTDYSSSPVSVAVASHDENGRLVSVEDFNGSVSGRYTVRVENPEDVKMFIWDGVAGMKPFTAPITYKK